MHPNTRGGSIKTVGRGAWAARACNGVWNPNTLEGIRFRRCTKVVIASAQYRGGAWHRLKELGQSQECADFFTRQYHFVEEFGGKTFHGECHAV